MSESRSESIATAPRPPSPPATAARWLGPDLADAPERWRRSWSPEQAAAMQSYVDQVDASALLANPAATLASLPTAPEPLTRLAEKIRSDLIGGLGFTLLTGFPIDIDDAATAGLGFLLFGALVGAPRSQNASGHLLGHVRNIGADVADPTVRIYQTDQRQTFHTDSTDAVALLCRRTAKEGGLSMLASVEAIYAEMIASEPTLAARLFEAIATDRRGEQPEGMKPWFEIPPLSWFDDHLTVMYQRQYIESARRFDAAPNPDAQYTAALDLFDEIANDPAMHLTMAFAPGDIQFVHNHSLLHDRTGFVDHEGESERRHLLRLWLSIASDRELPPPFTQRYGQVTVGDRGGIIVPGASLTVPLDAP